MKLALLGGGGHCHSCIEAIRSTGEEVAGIVDQSPSAEFFGVKRLGDDAWLEGEEARTFRYLIAVGQVGISQVRRKLFERLCSLGLNITTIVASNAVASKEAAVGAGTIVMLRAIVNAGAKVGMNCIVNTGAIVEHDATVGDHCHISTGSIVNGGASVGDGCMIGSGAVVLQGVKIAANVMIGAGAVVTKDIDTPGVWAGIPARRRS